ncbi:MAG: tetratricopeptide repeat protein [bacterium]
MAVIEITRPVPRQPGWLVALLPTVLIIWGFVGVYLLQLALDSTGRSRGERLMQELAYFPSGVALREVAVEYREILADFIWLTAIDYYGRHQETDRRYEWLGHIFEILTALDQRFIAAYHFGAITLAWDVHKPLEALRLLFNGMKSNPLNWQLPFDAGFINYMLIGDYDSAARLFQVAAKLPGAWSVVVRWVPYATARSGDFETARQMWRDLYYSTENRKLRELIIRQVRWLNLEEGLVQIQGAVDRFIEKEKRRPFSIEELVSRGYLKEIPEEPFGGRYFLDGAKARTTTPPSRRGEGI